MSTLEKYSIIERQKGISGVSKDQFFDSMMGKFMRDKKFMYQMAKNAARGYQEREKAKKIAEGTYDEKNDGWLNEFGLEAPAKEGVRSAEELILLSNEEVQHLSGDEKKAWEKVDALYDQNTSGFVALQEGLDLLVDYARKEGENMTPFDFLESILNGSIKDRPMYVEILCRLAHAAWATDQLYRHRENRDLVKPFDMLPADEKYKDWGQIVDAAQGLAQQLNRVQSGEDTFAPSTGFRLITIPEDGLQAAYATQQLLEENAKPVPEAHQYVISKMNEVFRDSTFLSKVAIAAYDEYYETMAGLGKQPTEPKVQITEQDIAALINRGPILPPEPVVDAALPEPEQQRLREAHAKQVADLQARYKLLDRIFDDNATTFYSLQEFLGIISVVERYTGEHYDLKAVVDLLAILPVNLDRVNYPNDLSKPATKPSMYDLPNGAFLEDTLSRMSHMLWYKSKSWNNTETTHPKIGMFDPFERVNRTLDFVHSKAAAKQLAEIIKEPELELA